MGYFGSYFGSSGDTTITIQPPLDADGVTIEIVRGGDYVDERSIALTIEGYAGPSLAAGTAYLKAMPTEDYNSGHGTATISVTGSVSVTDDTVTLTYEIEAADTSGLAIVPGTEGTLNYTYEAYVVTAVTSLTIPLALGSMTISRSVG